GRDMVGALLLSFLLFIIFVFVAFVAIGMAGAFAAVLISLGNPDEFARLSQGFQALGQLASNGEWEKVLRDHAYLVVRLVLLYIVAIFLFGFIFQAVTAAAFSRFQARWFNYVANRTVFGDVQMSSKVDTWLMFYLLFGNMILQVVTLGLARPFIAHR